MAHCVTSNNSVEIHLERIDNFEQVETAFEAEIIVVIADEQDVGSVGVLTGGELFVGLQSRRRPLERHDLLLRPRRLAVQPRRPVEHRHRRLQGVGRQFQ